MGHAALWIWKSHSFCLPSLHVREGSSIPGLFPSEDMANLESLVGIKPGDSGVVIGYQLMSLLTPGLQSGLLLIPTFILGSWVSVITFPLSPGV